MGKLEVLETFLVGSKKYRSRSETLSEGASQFYSLLIHRALIARHRGLGLVAKDHILHSFEG